MSDAGWSRCAAGVASTLLCGVLVACGGSWLIPPRVAPPATLDPEPERSVVVQAVAVAAGHVALARAEHVSDEGILPIEAADRIAAEAFAAAATEGQQVRAELLVAGADLRAIATGAGWETHPEHDPASASMERVAVRSSATQRTVRTESAEGARRTLRSVDAAPTPREVSTVALPEAEVAAAASPGPRSGSIERWMIPVREPRVTSRFGPRIDPITGAAGRMHRGIDYGHPPGTPVLATASGTVLLAGWCDSGTGNCVVIEHANGWRSQYFHLSAVHARAGRRVVQGEVIGEIGSTGRSTGPHLHFQIGPPGGALDPEPLFGTPVQ